MKIKTCKNLEREFLEIFNGKQNGSLIEKIKFVKEPPSDLFVGNVSRIKINQEVYDLENPNGHDVKEKITGYLVKKGLHSTGLMNLNNEVYQFLESKNIHSFEAK
ncbi:MAG: hypothetical protein KC516_01295 [Nanoarchaeota archaeon]|nr:hypothetical protein [Nanoarchaeota archaeon]